MPRAIKRAPKPEIDVSKALSLMALPGDGSIATRKVAILIADGLRAPSIVEVMEAVNKSGGVTRLLGSRLGTVTAAGGEQLEVDATLENSPAVLFDALVLPDGDAAIDALSKDGHTMEFVKDQYRHCKTILFLGAASSLLQKLGISTTLPSGEPDSGLLIGAEKGGNAQAFIAAIAKHRHPARDTDPPLI
jgi:catalase